MARWIRRLAANAAGPLVVDASRIDGGTCWRWDAERVAPGDGQATIHE